MLDDARRKVLLDWMRVRDYLWYDDRLLLDEAPVMQQRRGRMRTVYLYSNVVRRTTLLADEVRKTLPRWPLISHETRLTAQAPVALRKIKTTELAVFKDAYLGKNILHGQGHWAFAVVVDSGIVGFIEFSRGKFDTRELYLNADFPIAHTAYPRLSKLIVMLACAGETRQLMERITERRVSRFVTTAFTDKPVSMKYRGALDLVKRGTTSDGQAFLNYAGTFTTQTWQETLCTWLIKHGSTR